MANARTRKREIDKAKRERAANKRERRQERLSEDEAETSTAGQAPSQPSEDGVLAALETLHQRYDAEQISFEEFEEARTELLSRLTVN